MAKNNYLSGFFLCLIAGLCIGIRSLFVSFGYWTFGKKGNGFERVEEVGNAIIRGRAGCDSISAIILSGTEWSRKIPSLYVENARRAKPQFYAFNQWVSPLRYAPVEKMGMCEGAFNQWASPLRSTSIEMTEDRSGKFDVASSDADAVRNKVKKIYSAEIGVREKTGKNDGERVEEYLAITQLGKGYAWCAAFVSWVFAEAGFAEPRTPWSPALFPKKRVVWERGVSVFPTDYGTVIGVNVKDKLTIDLPKPADVFGIYFANLKRIAHVGFVDEWGDKHVITVEGNTNEAGGAEGDGVYRKRRPISSIYQVANWIDLEGKR